MSSRRRRRIYSSESDSDGSWNSFEAKEIKLEKDYSDTRIHVQTANSDSTPAGTPQRSESELDLVDMPLPEILTAVAETKPRELEEPASDVTPAKSLPTVSDSTECQCAIRLPAMQQDLATMKANMEKMAASMESLRQSFNDANNAMRSDLLPEFPITTTAQFEAFNKSLSKEPVRMQLANKLERIGGKTPKDAVRNAIATVLSIKVGSRYTWHGLRGKDILRTTPFGQLVLSVFTDRTMTEHNVGTIIGDWLRHESDKFKKQQQ